MCKKKELLKINMKIKKRSDKYYRLNPKVCVKHNLYVRCERFIKHKKMIWPPLKSCEIREFIAVTKLPNKYLKNIQ